MNDQISRKLWVIKFCLKVVYPKYNYYYFLVYLAIRYRIWNQKRNPSRENMDAFEIKTIPPYIVKTILKERLEENLPILLNKCLIISKEQFIQLGSENLFYLDNGVLWVALKLTASERRKLKAINDNKEIKYNLHFMTSELHKKLWTDSANSSIDNIRIVPIVGSKHVSENVAFTNEIEYFNINSCFGFNVAKDISITFHPMPCLDSAPKIAAVAEVSLIVNDYDLANDFIKEVLSNHFEVPKLVSTNDIISIDLTPDMTAKYHYKYLDLVNSTGRLYFKCKKLRSDANVTNDTKNKVVQAFFIVKGVTQLTLGENIHSMKPKDEYFKPPLNKNSNIITHLCPTGFKEKFNQIQETIYPFLTGELDDLLSSMSSPIIPMLLLTGATGSGRYLLVKILAKYNGMNCLAIDCNALQSSTAKQTESKINSTVQKAKAAAPVIVVLDNFEVFAVDPENNEDCRVLEYFMNTITDLYQNYTKHPIVFMAITERQDLKPNVLRLFVEKFHIPRLNVQQRYEMLEWFASVMQLNIDGEEIVLSNHFNPHEEFISLSKTSKDVLQRVAAKTETFLYGDIDTLLHFAIRESYLKQHNGYNQLPPDPNLHFIQEEDFNSALGILLYGPPGCGKTLVAKAVSTELNVSFLSVKGPELLNMYIGQSEENVRKVFESARASSPCIVFLDELDALAPRRGAAGDSGGASDRVVSQLLAELDGVASGEDADTSSFVFIMGATNRPDLLEQSLLRPGRLDKLIYVGPYCGLDEKTGVLKALCRNYKVREEVDLGAVAAALPDSCTGADLLQVVSTARAAAVRALVAKLHAGAVKESELSPDSVIIGATELLHAVESFRPSVTPDELAYYESLKSQM
ncbi:unnamed protein product [Chrysodeixis includens]|uniref:AAA+ ATPase domain-containing protein n=1 Tax=Chrysodeixis includens TaxID=689277 RepID=A0A9P0FSC0_CHRIL|nr:unnamed protein product [Chrysodeixis includens]